MSDTKQFVTFIAKNFDTEVIKSDLPVLVDFWAAWCGPCRVMNPIIENIATQWLGIIKVGKANIDDNEDIATKYSIEAIPTILLFQNGEVIDKIPGLISQQALEDKLNALTNSVVAG